MIALKQYIKVLRELKLTQSQLLFLMLVKNKNHLHGTAEEYFKYLGDLDTLIPRTLLNELVEKHYLKYLIPKPVRLEDYEVTQVIHDLFIDMYEDANEFLRAYPATIKLVDKGIQRIIPTTTVDATVFRTKYAELVKYSKEEHDLMMADLKYAIENQLITTGIDKYLASEMYLRIREERLGDKHNTADVPITNNDTEQHEF